MVLGKFGRWSWTSRRRSNVKYRGTIIGNVTVVVVKPFTTGDRVLIVCRISKHKVEVQIRHKWFIVAVV